MTNWAARRFWKEAKGEQVADGWQVMLDTRPIRTPAGAALVVPTQPLAGAIASEWDAQEDIVDPRTMPMTRTANSAIDKVAPQKNAVVSILSDYGATDLLSYRADSPRALMMRQSQLWDPILEWADRELGARLAVTEGVMPVPQDGAALDRLTAPMLAMSAFQLAAFHDLVALSGSLVLAHATTQGSIHRQRRGNCRGWTRTGRPSNGVKTRKRGMLPTASGHLFSKRIVFGHSRPDLTS